MIRINLLPQEEQRSIRYSQLRIPIVPILILIFFLLCVSWGYILISITYLSRRIDINVKQLAQIDPRRTEVDQVWEELHKNLLIRKGFVESVMVHRLEWAYILNIVSDYTTQGIWLYYLSVEEKDNNLLLTIQGIAKPVTARSMIKDIGNYVSRIKEALETKMLSSAQQTEQLADYVTVSTTTKRKKAERLELTDFTTTFKIAL